MTITARTSGLAEASLDRGGQFPQHLVVEGVSAFRAIQRQGQDLLIDAA